MYLYKACFSAFCIEVIYGFSNRVANRTHSDNDMFRILCAIIIERLVIRADLFINHVHIHNRGLYGIVIILVASLSVLEEDIRVLGRAAKRRMLRIQSVRSETLNIFHIHHIFQIIIIPNFDLLDLVRSTETIKEMKERNGTLKCGEVRNCTEIHNFLRVIGAKHCITGLAAGINIRMIAENIQRMGRYAACRYMNYRRKKLTGDLIHIRDHEKKTLRRRVSGCERTGGKRAVNCAGSAAL